MKVVKKNIFMTIEIHSYVPISIDSGVVSLALSVLICMCLVMSCHVSVCFNFIGFKVERAIY